MPSPYCVEVECMAHPKQALTNNDRYPYVLSFVPALLNDSIDIFFVMSQHHILSPCHATRHFAKQKIRHLISFYTCSIFIFLRTLQILNFNVV